MLSVPSIIEIAKVSQYLAQNDIDDKGLYGGGIDLNLPQKLYNIRKSVEWMYDQDNTEPSLSGTSEYLLALCSKYRALAELNLQPNMDYNPFSCFPPTIIGEVSESQSTIVRFYNLPYPGDIIFGSDSSFQMSYDNVNWTDITSPDLPSISYNTRNPDLIKLYARFAPQQNGNVRQGGYFSVAPSSGGYVPFTIPLCGESPVPNLFVNPSELTFLNSVIYSNQILSFNLSGIDLNVNDDIVITSPSNNYQLSLDGTIFSSSLTIPLTSMTLPSTTISVKFSPQSAGVKSGNITIVGGGDSINVAVTGTGVAASLTATPSTITAFSSTPVGTVSASKTFAVTGTFLQGSPNVVTITSPSVDFQVSNNNTTWGASTTIPFTSPTLTSTTVYVRFSPQSGGSKSGNVTVSGGGASTVNVAVSGAAAAASVTVGSLTDFGWKAINTGTSQFLSLTGTGLDGTPLIISGSTNFRVSLDGGATTTNGSLNIPYTGSSVSLGSLAVVFFPLTVGAKSENITISGGGLSSPINVAVTGTGVVEFSMNYVGATRIKMQYVQSATTKIVWGDGTVETITGTTVTPDHTYATALTSFITIQMNAYANITQFFMNFGETSATSINISRVNFVKLSALTNCILDSKVTLGSAVQPVFTTNLPQLLTSLTVYKGYITGGLSGFPPGLTFLDIRDFNDVTNALVNLFNRCPSLTNVFIDGGNTIHGDIEDIPSGVTSIKIFGNNTITCATKDLSVIPTSVIKFRILGNNTIAGSLQDISHWSTIEEFSIGGVLNAPSLNQTSYIEGTLNNITFSSNLKIFQLTYGVNTVSGQISNTTSPTTFQLPSGIEVFEVRGETTLDAALGNTISGTISNFPTSLKTLNVGGLNTISGNLNTYSSSSIRTFIVDGLNTVSGLLQNAPANVQYFQLTGLNTVSTYTTSRVWGASGVMNYFALYSNAPGYTGFTVGTQSQLNQLFVDLNLAQWVDYTPLIPRKITYPRQGTVVPTGAGATALTSLTTIKGVTVTPVTYP